MKAKLIVIGASLIAALVLIGAAIMGYQDWQIRTGGAPGSPASGYVRTSIDSSAPTLINCKTSTGAPCSFAGSTITLQTNGTNNGSQSILNLAAGSNMTLTDNGSGTVTFASTGGGSGLFPNVVAPPSTGSWTWVPSSQGTATLSSNLALQAPSGGSGYEWRMVYVTAPSAPFTIYAGIYPTTFNGDLSGVGIFARQSINSRFVIFYTSPGGILGGTYSAYNVGVANFSGVGMSLGQNVLWLKFQDDKGTSGNFLLSESNDGGYSWVQVGSYGITTYLTGDPDQIGFAVRGGSSVGSAGTLYSWNVTTP